MGNVCFRLNALKPRERLSMLLGGKRVYKFIWSLPINALILCSVAAFEANVIEMFFPLFVLCSFTKKIYGSDS